MNNGNPNEDEKGTKPPRVPLLEDVITPGDATNKPAGKNGSKAHSLAPNLEPQPESAPTGTNEVSADEPTEKEASPAPGEDEGSASGDSSERIAKGVKLDPYIREWLLENAKSMSGVGAKGINRQAVLRAGAELMVDNLVKEYSQEIVERLRKELTSLLEELNIDKEKPGHD